MEGVGSPSSILPGARLEAEFEGFVGVSHKFNRGEVLACQRRGV